MTKQRVALIKTPPHVVGLYHNPSVEKRVVEVRPGEVNWVDKAKGYYKGLIALVGVLLIAFNQLSGTLPDPIDRWVTVLIGIFTTLGVILRANEVWISEL